MKLLIFVQELKAAHTHDASSLSVDSHLPDQTIKQETEPVFFHRSSLSQLFFTSSQSGKRNRYLTTELTCLLLLQLYLRHHASLHNSSTFSVPNSSLTSEPQSLYHFRSNLWQYMMNDPAAEDPSATDR